MESFINNILSHPRMMFIIDAMGATISSIMLGVVLVCFQGLVGMPLTALEYLSGSAFAIALFSWSCYLGFEKFGKHLFKVIGFINILYCLVSIGFVLYYNQELTSIGYLYFIVEILIIAMIAYIEIKVSKVQFRG